jgi:hypothetical protein
MDAGIAQTLIATIGSVLVALITVVVKGKLDARKQKSDKEKEEAIDECDLEEMVTVQDWLEEFRDRYDFARAAIFQFHNGGKFFQGKSMKKFSMTYESVAPGYEKIKRSQQNILASEYPRWIGMMMKSKCFSNIVDEMSPGDQVELRKYGIEQFVTVPIFCIKGKLIGFIVGYNISTVNEKISESYVSLVEDSKFISGYLRNAIC